MRLLFQHFVVQSDVSDGKYLCLCGKANTSIIICLQLQCCKGWTHHAAWAECCRDAAVQLCVYQAAACRLVHQPKTWFLHSAILSQSCCFFVCLSNKDNISWLSSSSYHHLFVYSSSIQTFIIYSSLPPIICCFHILNQIAPNISSINL